MFDDTGGYTFFGSRRRTFNTTSEDITVEDETVVQVIGWLSMSRIGEAWCIFGDHPVSSATWLATEVMDHRNR